MWVRLCIYLQQNMKSKYGIALWENLSDYAKLQKISYDIDQFKQLMGIQPHQYKVITMLKKKVIDVGLNEVNKETTLRAEYKFVKTGNKITGITFFVKNIVKAIDPEHINKQIYTKMKYYGFKDIEIKKLLKERDEDYLMSNIAVVETYLEKGMDIKNVRAYMKTAFKDDYRQHLSLYEQEQQEKEGQQQAEEKQTKKEELTLAILKGEFNQIRKVALEKAKSELTEKQLLQLKAEFEKEMEQKEFLKEQYLKKGFEHFLIQTQRKNFLTERLLPSDLHNFENYRLRPLETGEYSNELSLGSK